MRKVRGLPIPETRGINVAKQTRVKCMWITFVQRDATFSREKDGAQARACPPPRALELRATRKGEREKWESRITRNGFFRVCFGCDSPFMNFADLSIARNELPRGYSSERSPPGPRKIVKIRSGG